MSTKDSGVTEEMVEAALREIDAGEAKWMERRTLVRKALEAAQAVAPPKERSLEAQRIAESAWPPRDVVTRLVECADILFDKHDYDGDGWEVLHSARAVARKWLASSPAAPPKETADTKRLDWLASEASKRGPVNSINVDVPPLVAVISYDPMWTLREAVDMAMGGEAVDVRTDKSSPAAPATPSTGDDK